MKKISSFLFEFLTVIAFITILIYFGLNLYNSLFNDFSKYTVNFNDIDGLGIGSPVRLAGVRIGHVVRQELKDDKILVTFKIINKKTKIPKGTTAGIEFFGLGGSKSLELQPPSPDNKGEAEIKAVDPLRIDSLKEIINILSESTLDFSKAVFSFLNKNAQDAEKNLKNTSDLIKEKSRILQKTMPKVKKTGSDAAEKAAAIKNMLIETNNNIDNVKNTMGEIATKEEIKKGLNSLKDSTQNLIDFVETNEAKEKINELDLNVKNFNIKAKQLNEKISKIKDREVGYIKEFNQSLKTTVDKMHKLMDSINDKPSGS